MRMAKALGLAACLAGTLTACNDGSGGASVNSSIAPGTLVQTPPFRVASLTAAALSAQLGASSQGQQLLALAGTPACGVDFYYIQYQTTGGAGEQASASGALMMPTGTGCTGARSILLYAHGTAFQKSYNMANISDSTNPAWAESALVAAMYAAQGYIVVAPNYTGYDSSNLSYHPYLNAAANAQDMIDALTAARSAIPTTFAGANSSDSGKLFISGYSEGGYVAMATEQAMQAKGMTVTAAAPMSGPYAVEALFDAVIFGNVAVGATTFMPFITTSYQKSYGGLYNATTDIYNTTYASGIDTLFPSSESLTQIFASGKLPPAALWDSTTPVTGTALDALLAVPTSNPLFAQGFGTSYLVNNSARLGYALDAAANPDGGASSPPAAGVPLSAMAQYPLRADARKNDMRNWTAGPSVPTLLCGGHSDPTIFFALNAQIMQAFWPTQSTLGLLTVLDVDPGIAFAAGGTESQIATIAATALGADLAGGITSPATLGNDMVGAAIQAFPLYFTGGVANSPQGVVVEAAAGIAAQAALADLGAGVTSVTTIGSDMTTALFENFHASVEPPACNLAARGFFAHF